ncbi:ABC transporter substrate-binding protein [Geodermatophilus sp. SYSU D01186]
MRKALTVLGAAMVVVVAACGTEGESAPAGEGGSGLQDVTVGVSTVVDVAPVYLGISEGIFEEHGLEVTPQTTSGGGAALLPLVLNGEVDFAYGNVVSLLKAREEGLDVRAVTHGSSSPGRQAGTGLILVGGDSPVQDAADLEGKTVAVNSLASLTEVMVHAAIERAGGDPAKVTLVELPVSDMIPALERGEVDAITEYEPFGTIAKQAGARPVAYTFDLTETDTLIASYFTSGTLAEQDPELVETFKAAMNEALDFAQDHPEAVREAVDSYMDLDPAVTAELTLPGFGSDLDQDALREIAGIARERGLLEEEPQVEQLLVEDQ